MELNRRDMIKLGGLGAAGVAAGSMLPVGDLIRANDASTIDPAFLPDPFATAFRRPPVLRPFARRRGADGVWTDSYEVCEELVNAKILKGGRTTKMFGYNGMVPGPTIKATRAADPAGGPQPPSAPAPLDRHETATSMHLHGSASKPQYDGYANDITPPGFYKDYHYPNFQPARTLWYHDHGAHHTAQNVFSGPGRAVPPHDKVEQRCCPRASSTSR